MLIILACIVGVLIGLTLNVFVLLPVILAGAAAYACVAQGQGLGEISAAIVMSAVALRPVTLSASPVGTWSLSSGQG